jgi:hypothetical protein
MKAKHPMKKLWGKLREQMEKPKEEKRQSSGSNKPHDHPGEVEVLIKNDWSKHYTSDTERG